MEFFSPLQSCYKWFGSRAKMTWLRLVKHCVLSQKKPRLTVNGTLSPVSNAKSRQVIHWAKDQATGFKTRIVLFGVSQI